MLDFVRTHQRWLQFILLLLILPAFVLTGVASFSGSSADNVVAKVGSREISQQEFASRYQRFVENARRQMGEQFDATYYQSPEAKSAYLTQISNEALVEDMLSSGKMTASDMEVAQALARMQGMPKNAQGGIDEAAYKATLAQQGLTPAAHQFGVRADLVKAQLSPAYSLLSLPVSSDFMKSFFGRARVLEIKSLDLTPYMAQTNVTPEQLQAYYDQHKTQFNTPDVFDVEYAVVPVQGSGASASLTDEDIKAVFGNDATTEQLNKVRQDPNQSKVVLAQVGQKKLAARLDELIGKTPQDLGAVAKAVGATVQQAKGLTRQAAGNTPDVFKDAKVREALLNATQAESKNIAPIMALGSGDLLVARVSGYRAAGVRSFDEVKSEVEQQLRREAAVAKATQDAQNNLNGQSAGNSIGAPQMASWFGGSPAVTPAIAAKVMNMPANGLPALIVVSDKDRVDVVRVVKEDSLPPDQAAQIGQLAQGVWNGPNESLAYGAYMAALRERMGVKLYPERIKATRE